RRARCARPAVRSPPSPATARSLSSLARPAGSPCGRTARRDHRRRPAHWLGVTIASLTALSLTLDRFRFLREALPEYEDSISYYGHAQTGLGETFARGSCQRLGDLARGAQAVIERLLEQRKPRQVGVCEVEPADRRGAADPVAGLAAAEQRAGARPDHA